MSASEFSEWMEYDRLEPFGHWRDNWHAAIVAAILANAHRDPSSKPFQIQDFMYVDSATNQEQKDAAMLAFLEQRVKDG